MSVQIGPLPWVAFFVWDDSEEDAKPAAPNMRAFTPFQAAQEFVENECFDGRDEHEVAVQSERDATPTLYIVRREWVAEKSRNKWKP